MKQVFATGQYANVTATLALVVALGGTSYAAIKLPANSVGAKQLKKSAVTAKKIRRGAVTSPAVKNGSLRASDFKAGQLPSGAQGPIGSRGLSGPPGAPGPPGPLVDTLPRGTSVRGSFLLAKDSTHVDDVAATSISYGFELADEPTVQIISPNGALPEGCSGTPYAPDASPGFVCVFVIYASENSNFGIFQTELAPHRFGLGLRSYATTATGRNQVDGSWVATGS